MSHNIKKEKGWIKGYRYWLDDPIILKDSDHFSIWILLVLSAAHKEREFEFGGKRCKLNPGELITGRKSISSKLKINESKVQRILKCLHNNGLIFQKTTNRFRFIKILSLSLMCKLFYLLLYLIIKLQ